MGYVVPPPPIRRYCRTRVSTRAAMGVRGGTMACSPQETLLERVKSAIRVYLRSFAANILYIRPG
jgi:hypothetical protein